MTEHNLLDLGAHIGLFSTIAAVSGARVICVEAQSGVLPYVWDGLRVSTVEGRVNVYLSFVGSLGLLSGEAKCAGHWGVDPPSVTISELLLHSGWERTDLVKIDIEASEFGLFSGDPRWPGVVQRIAMKIHPASGDSILIAGLLGQTGFKLRLIDNRGRPVGPITEMAGIPSCAKICDGLKVS
jgi:hypothetical protein